MEDMGVPVSQLASRPGQKMHDKFDQYVMEMSFGYYWAFILVTAHSLEEQTCYFMSQSCRSDGIVQIKFGLRLFL